MDGKSFSRVLVGCTWLALTALPVRSQTLPDSPRTTTVIAGDYAAGGFHRFFFGTHYRELWTTPVRVEILDLENFAGGLKPLKRGGGFQTKSLRFEGKTAGNMRFVPSIKTPRKFY